MERYVTLFLGVLLTFTSSWLGLVFAPYVQMNRLEPHYDETTKTIYPRPIEGTIAEGRKVYQISGCYYCHSQQNRSQSFGQGADIGRGWAVRRTVPRDYMYEKPIMLGTMRTGPDLANSLLGHRKDPVWQHQHLYEPRMVVPGSLMPSFSYLYEKRRIVGQQSREAVPIPEAWQRKFGLRNEKDELVYEIIPTPEAKALVDYLTQLNHNEVELPEAKE